MRSALAVTPVVTVAMQLPVTATTAVCSYKGSDTGSDNGGDSDSGDDRV